jgi:hypothetical protein
METTVNLLEKKLKGYSVAQLKSKLQRGCPELDKEICISILKKRGEDTSKWEVSNEKLGIFINEVADLTPEEVEIIEEVEIAEKSSEDFEKQKHSSKLKQILKSDKKLNTLLKISVEKPNIAIDTQVEFISSRNSKIAPKQLLKGCVKSIFICFKTHREFARIQTDKGMFLKSIKACEKI